MALNIGAKSSHSGPCSATSLNDAAAAIDLTSGEVTALQEHYQVRPADDF